MEIRLLLHLKSVLPHDEDSVTGNYLTYNSIEFNDPYPPFVLRTGFASYCVETCLSPVVTFYLTMFKNVYVKLCCVLFLIPTMVSRQY